MWAFCASSEGSGADVLASLNSRKKVRAVMSGPDNTSNRGGPMPLVDMSGARGVPGIGFVVETQTDMPDDIAVSLDKHDRPNESQGK
jgi:hypothetical protein